jgi:hypothetical protein
MTDNSKDKQTSPDVSEAEALERMNEALKRALNTPPRKHKDEPKRGGRGKREKKSSG